MRRLPAREMIRLNFPQPKCSLLTKSAFSAVEIEILVIFVFRMSKSVKQLIPKQTEVFSNLYFSFLPVLPLISYTLFCLSFFNSLLQKTFKMSETHESAMETDEVTLWFDHNLRFSRLSKLKLQKKVSSKLLTMKLRKVMMSKWRKKKAMKLMKKNSK